MRLRMAVLASVLALTSATLVRAQETTGTVTGRVTDAQGLAIPGATVTLTGPQGAKSFTSDSDGRYNAPLLVPGTYTVKAELQGFKTVEQQGVVVRLGQTIEVPLAMQVGGMSRDGRGHRVIADRRYQVDDRRRRARQCRCSPIFQSGADSVTRFTSRLA